MFKKSRRKIIAAILFVLAVLFFGTFAVIYLTSYAEVTERNQGMLRMYVESYTLSEGQRTNERGEDDGADRRGGRRSEGPPGSTPNLELSTFYSAAVSETGEILAVDNGDVCSISEEDLGELAREIIESGETEGTRRNLVFRAADKGDYTLVAFLDNTVMMGSTGTLIRHTLIFGGAALVIMFFLARYLAGKIVSPLEESYQKQRQFISDAGHELKTPVAVINANLELLSREIGGNQWLSNIRYENDRMSVLISELLELTRAENAAPQMEPVDLSRLVCGEALPFETVAYENGLELECDIAENVWVNGNSVQLKQLVSILIDNAIQHGKAIKEVKVILKKEKNNAVLSVINGGDPIPPEEQENIFERFYRLDEARSGDGGHYGLGLAIAKSVTESHKGTISVQCYSGKIELTVRLPIRKQAAKNI